MEKLMRAAVEVWYGLVSSTCKRRTVGHGRAKNFFYSNTEENSVELA